jgi:hypothetical protein
MSRRVTRAGVRKPPRNEPAERVRRIYGYGDLVTATGVRERMPEWSWWSIAAPVEGGKLNWGVEVKLE